MIKTDKNIRDSYKTYVQHSTAPVDIKTYILIATQYNKFIMDKVLEGYEIVLPAKTGTLTIVGTKPDIKFDENGVPNLPINWPATWNLRRNNEKAKEERRVVYHTNDHTDGVRYKYFWSKKRIFAVNKNLYSLRLTRENKRAVTRMVENGKEYYVKSK